MEENALLYIGIGLIVSYLILFLIIQTAVKGAMKDLESKTDIQIRLLVKILEHKGVPKGEIADIFEHSNDAFWDSIKENNRP